ncbi:MAG: ribosome-binding factor A [Bacteroidetes bacterium GWE2_29_8]|nr:MAG: ribosome-binding factor A [Bacteroidetes bacterium GWE2_29_8]OFY20113.1 MAG: ribosome-binding factor A [Bacteroidetes bacterium GWF2_29_10]
MYSIRQNKISRLVQKEISEIILFDTKNNALGRSVIVTVTSVKVSQDLSIAKIYLSIFSTNNTKEEILKLIKQKSSEYRNLLGIKVRHQLRIVPQLAFYIDDSLDYIAKIDDLLNKQTDTF